MVLRVVSGSNAPGRFGARAVYSGFISVSITGTFGAGNTLTATLNPSLGSAATYQWSRNGGPISGATSSSYLQVGADLGTSLSVNINSTYTGSVYIPAIPPVFSTAPTITTASTTGVIFTPAILNSVGTPVGTLTYDLYDNGSLAFSNYVSGGTFTVGHTMTLIPYAIQGGVRVLQGPVSTGVMVISAATGWNDTANWIDTNVWADAA